MTLERGGENLVSNILDHNPATIESHIYAEDFLKSEKFLESMQFDVVIADPPYNIGKDFGNNKDAMPLKDYVSWTEKWLEMCFRHLKDDGIIYMYGFPEIVAHIACKYPLQNQKWLVWHYTNKAVPSLRFWQRSHETILCMWKGKRPKLNIDAIREEYTQGYKKCIGKIRRGTPSRFGSGKNTVYNGHANGALPRDVLKNPALAGGAGRKERLFVCHDCEGGIFHSCDIREHDGHNIEKHPTQKPMELTKRLIHSVVREGHKGSVLIPFSGTGSECVVSKSLGIHYIAFDMNPKYVDFAKRWLEKVEHV